MSASEGSRSPSAVVIDQWEIYRLGIEKVLSDLDILVTNSTSRFEEAFPLTRSAAVNMFIVGQTTDLKPQRALNDIKQANTDSKVILLVDRADGPTVAQLVSKGVDGLLLRSAPASQLDACVTSVLEGNRFIAPALSTATLGRVGPALKEPKAELAEGLSPREREVLGELATGASYEQIAASLLIGRATVKTHLVHIYDKLEVKNRQEAITKALGLGLLS